MSRSPGSEAAVSRLLTFADLDDRLDPGPNSATMTVRARHEAVLADGRRVVLLDDRGWTSTIMGFVPSGTPSAEEPRSGAWEAATAESIERTARRVVGPDEPYGGRTREEMEAGHWQFLSEILRRQGFEAEPAELKALPHDVELGARLRARLGER